jgi:hypothetical protein
LVTPEGEREWRILVSSRLASLQRRDVDVTVGIVFQDDRHGSLEGVPLPRFGVRTQAYVGARDGTRYCFIVLPERYPVTNAALRRATTLDRCEWFAKYGMPGTPIRGWLEAGAFDFAREAVVENIGVLLGPPSTQLPFGMSRPFEESVLAASCLAGDAAACERRVIDPEALAFRHVDPLLVASSPMAYMSPILFTDFSVLTSFMLAELEARYGPEAFADFWRSEEEVPVAFEAAFGVELGVWVRDWTQEELGAFRATPAPRAATLGWSVVTLLVLSGFASWTQLRRRVA